MHYKRCLGLTLAIGAIGSVQTPGSQDGQLIRLAIELAAERDPVPIPLGAERSNPSGIAYDRFTRAHLAARAAALRGAPLNPLNPPRDVFTGQLIVVAVPLVCGERTVRPTDVDVHTSTRPVAKFLPVTGAAIQKLLPGVSVPSGAIAVLFSDSALRAGQVVRFSYAGAVCSGESRTVSIPVTTTAPRVLERPAIEVPPNQPPPAGPIELTISGVVDLDGRLRYATAPEASTPFGAAAMAAAMKMRFDPARINGTPTLWTAGVIATFGVPAPAPAPAELSTPDAPRPHAGHQSVSGK